LFEKIKTIDDEVITRGINAWEFFLLNEIKNAVALRSDISTLLKNCKPRVILFNYLSLSCTGVLAEEAIKYNIPRYLITHGTHSVTNSSVSKYEQKNLGRGLIFSPLATTTIAQSPSANRFLDKYHPKVNKLNSQPIMWGYKKSSVPPNDGIFRILYTGTYHNFRHWIWETPDEYIYGLYNFVKSTANIDNIKIIIRFRERSGSGINLNTVKTFLKGYNHFQINTTGSFINDLSLSNLLVSYVSTTIEESLIAKRPVLLYGYSNRYSHLVASSKLPTSDKRSSVYKLNNKTQLIPMVSAIIKHHKNSLLSYKELHNYIWMSNEAMSIERLYRNIIEQ
jgi:hypothetical protein